MEFVGDARVIDLLLGGELQNQRHEQALHLDASGGALLHHLFEQNALVRHVLVDNPQAVAAGGEDEAFVDLAERPQIGERCQSEFSGAGIADAGNSPCASRRRESLPDGGGPGVTASGGALKSRRGRRRRRLRGA